MKVLIASTAGLVSLATIAMAVAPGAGDGGWGGGGLPFGGDYGSFGGDGCGGCVSDELKASAPSLETSFRAESEEVLLGEKYDRILCAAHPCGSFSEDVAADFLDDLLSAYERAANRKTQNRSLVIGLAGLAASLVALFQTYRSNKRVNVIEANSKKKPTRAN
ncbi:MAG: hypothetical protein V4551_15410 [Pseudomonadota bacterium]